MKKIHSLRLAIAGVALFVFSIGCNTPADTKPTAAAEATGQKTVMPDMTAIKAEIQTLENAWADADNARNANAIAAFYADDAVSLPNNKPLIVGKAALQQDIETSLAKRAKGSTVSYDIMDVFGSENTATEVGKITVRDSTGKVTYTGKYMAIWEKRDGKYVCVRDMSNDDVKEK